MMRSVFKLMLVVACSQGLTAQFLPERASSEENAGQGAGSKETSCQCGWTNKQSRITGGTQVDPNEFPMMAAIQRHPGQVICGGSIITNRHILTAAHCTLSLKCFVVVGTHAVWKNKANSTQPIAIQAIIKHEDYKSTTFTHDIAIIVLKTPITFNKFVGPVCLPTAPTNLTDQYIKAVGWGITDQRRPVSHLLKVNLKVLSMDKCDSYNQAGMLLDSNRQFCASRANSNKGVCEGDSGGPLMWNDPETNRLTQVGIVSFGRLTCGVGHPSVQTNVIAYLPWIRDAIAASGVESPICQKV